MGVEVQTKRFEAEKIERWNIKIKGLERQKGAWKKKPKSRLNPRTDGLIQRMAKQTANSQRQEDDIFMER